MEYASDEAPTMGDDLEDPRKRRSASERELTKSINSVGRDFRPVVKVRTGMLEVAIVCFYAAMIAHYPVIQQYVYNRMLVEQRHVGNSGNHFHHGSVRSNSSEQKSCRNTSSSNGTEAQAQSDSAEWLLYIGLANSIPGIFSTLVIGSITDNRGRKLGMVIPGIGAIIKIGLTMLVIKLDWPLFVLLIGGFIDGCLGSFGAAFTTAFAYLADITSPGKQRIWRITVLEASVNVCVSAVSFGIGYFIRSTGYFYPLAASLGLFVFTIAFIVVCLPETITSQPEVSIFGCSRLRSSVATYIKPREGTKRLQLLCLLMAYLVLHMVFISKGVIGSLYQMGFPFCWHSVKLGIYSAVGIVIQTASMLILLRPLTKCLHENFVSMIGTISAVGELTLTGLAYTDVMLFLVPVIGFAVSMPSALIKAVMSLMVGPEEQGSLFAGISSILLVCFSSGAAIFNPIYMSSVNSFSGLVFIVMACVLFLAVILLGFVEVLRRKDTRNGRHEYQIIGKPGD